LKVQNRKLLWTAVIAFCVAGVAAFLNSPKKAGAPAPPVPAPKTVEAKPHFVAVRPRMAPVVPGDPAELAVAKVRELFAEDHDDQDGRAVELLNEYCRDGKFQIALKLVDAVPADMRHDWLTIVFSRWAERQPWQAMNAVASMTDPAQRETTFRAAVDGWNSHDPGGLADYAVNMPASDDRTYALIAAIGNWSMQDPAGMAAWLNNLPRGDEYDYGVAMMLARSDGANRSPQMAMQWVENISNPTYKQSSFQSVLAEWMQTDANAARQYVATATWLDDATRAKILGGL